MSCYIQVVAISNSQVASSECKLVLNVLKLSNNCYNNNKHKRNTGMYSLNITFNDDLMRNQNITISKLLRWNF